jgi:RNA polymerase sigma factor (sigma-70 family)
MAESPPIAPTSASDDDLGGIYRDVAPRLRRYFRRRTGDHFLAEDLVHQVMLRLQLAQRCLALRFDPRAWVWVFAARVLRQDGDPSQKEVPTDPELLDNTKEASWTPTDEQVEHRRRARDVYAILSRLPRVKRLAFTLPVNYGFTSGEVADLLGIPEELVLHLADHTRLTLRSALGERNK